MNRGRGSNRGGGGDGRHYASRGRSPRSADHYVVRRVPVGSGAQSAGASSGSGSSEGGRRNPESTSIDGVTKEFDRLLSSDFPHGPSSEPCGVGKLVQEAEPRTPLNVTSFSPCYDNNFPSLSTPSEQITGSPKITESYFSSTPHVNATDEKRETSQSTGGQVQSGKTESEGTIARNELENSDSQSKEFSFDIRVEGNKSVVKLNSSLLVTNRAKRDEKNLLKGYMSLMDQVTSFLPLLCTGGQVQSGKTESEGTIARNELENSDSQSKEFSFDSCVERNKSVVKLNSSLVTNRAKRDEKKCQDQGDNIQVVRPGMILLKGYISLMDQVKLIKSCRKLGRGPGGFYQPGYRDGAKLHLKMMCLGKNWDPETCSYTEIRPIDHAKPPPIPTEFQQLVKGVIQKCHGYLESNSHLRNAKNSLPSMSPNICIINFYTQTGKRGLHQDKDESPESLRKGLPVVSISLGDAAEFIYGDQRDIDRADRVVLESGDVLVFGGESRLIFHGVSSIIPGTAPNRLLEETDLRPGRLNLSFREY